MCCRCHVPGLHGAQASRQPRPARPRSCRSSNGPAASCSTRRRSSCTACCAIFPTGPSPALARLLIFPRGLTYFAPADRLGRARRRAGAHRHRHPRQPRPLHLLRRASPATRWRRCSRRWRLAAVAEPLERKLRIEGQKTGRVTALDLPGQIEQARALGILDERRRCCSPSTIGRVMEIINVDDFAPHELAAGDRMSARRQQTPRLAAGVASRVRRSVDAPPLRQAGCRRLLAPMHRRQRSTVTRGEDADRSCI